MEATVIRVFPEDAGVIRLWVKSRKSPEGGPVYQALEITSMKGDGSFPFHPAEGTEITTGPSKSWHGSHLAEVPWNDGEAEHLAGWLTDSLMEAMTDDMLSDQQDLAEQPRRFADIQYMPDEIFTALRGWLAGDFHQVQIMDPMDQPGMSKPKDHPVVFVGSVGDMRPWPDSAPPGKIRSEIPSGMIRCPACLGIPSEAGAGGPGPICERCRGAGYVEGGPVVHTDPLLTDKSDPGSISAEIDPEAWERNKQLIDSLGDRADDILATLSPEQRAEHDAAIKAHFNKLPEHLKPNHLKDSEVDLKATWEYAEPDNLVPLMHQAHGLGHLLWVNRIENMCRWPGPLTEGQRRSLIDHYLSGPG